MCPDIRAEKKKMNKDQSVLIQRGVLIIQEVSGVST